MLLSRRNVENEKTTDLTGTDLYKRAIGIKGATHQLGKLIEEMGELIVEVQRAINADTRASRANILDERIDVEQTLKYIDIAFGFTEEELERKRAEKQKKLADQLGL